MKIVSLEAENVKRLRAVRIEPDGSAVVIGGRNGQGKSSVLDSIAAALGGLRVAPDEPIRRGEESASVVVDLGELVVSRKWTESGRSYLSVANKDGAEYKSPQKMLDKLVGRLSFDPLAWLRQDDKAKAEEIRALVGLDTTDIDRQRAEAFEARKVAKREAAAAKARADAAPHYPDAPEQEVSTASLLQELREADDVKREADEANRTYRRHMDRRAGVSMQIGKNYSQIEQLQQEIARLREDNERVTAELRAFDVRADELFQAAKRAEERAESAPDAEAIQRKAAEVELDNEHIRANATRQRLQDEHTEALRSVAAADGQIKKLDAAKRELIASANIPIDGLGFDDNGPTFNDLPISQASSAEQLRISVALGLAANPRLKILLIRDGSLLDSENLATVATMAADAGAQVWIERVGNDGATVIIEDGEVSS